MNECWINVYCWTTPYSAQILGEAYISPAEAAKALFLYREISFRFRLHVRLKEPR